MYSKFVVAMSRIYPRQMCVVDFLSVLRLVFVWIADNWRVIISRVCVEERAKREFMRMLGTALGVDGYPDVFVSRRTEHMGLRLVTE